MKILITLFFLSITALFSAQNVQVVKSSEVKVNGKLKLFASKKEYLQIMGKPTTMKRDFPGCSNYDEEVQKGASFYIYHKSGIKYLVYGNHADFERLQ